MPQQQQDQARLKALAKSPYLFDQGPHGSCGFAGTLMGLLMYEPNEVRGLYNTVSTGMQYRDVAESKNNIKSRLEKRMGLGLVGKALDVRLSIGLMLTFKEYLRQANRAQVWDDCRTYSELFEDSGNKKDWEYGGKLKDQMNANPHLARFRLNFSYKHGDLALTQTAQMRLLEMVGFQSIARSELISNQDAALCKNDFARLLNNNTFAGNLVTLMRELTNGTHSGALLGVASNDFLGEAAHAAYDYIAHWVYLPRPQQAGPQPQNLLNTLTWTWGQALDLWALLNRGYLPKVAVTFKA